MKFWCYVFIFSCFYAGTLTDVSTSSCIAPNGEQGSCISAFMCPYFQTLQNPLATIQKFACGETNSFMSCCPAQDKIETTTKTTTTTTSARPLTKREKALKFLPSKKFCGLQHTDDYFYTENVTSVDEYPWLVYIPLTDYLPDLHLIQRGKNCIGVLISTKHVLTDIKCKGASVVLGLHSLDEDISCIKTPYVTAPLDCTNPLVVENIDKTIPIPNSRIALVILRRPISYSDHVRPICLPIDINNPPPQENDTVISTGWGADEYTDGRSIKVKKRIKHRLMKNEDCAYGNFIRHPVCGFTPLDSDDFVCEGDNGSGLMYRYPRNKRRQNWILLGIITGRVDCDERQPVAAEGINDEILDWLLDHIER